jgi:hypothetical protein
VKICCLAAVPGLARSVGPFTMPVPAAAAGAAASVSVAMVSNFPFGSGVSAVRLPQAHLLTSAHFRARAPGPVSGRLYDTTAWRSSPACRCSRCVSAAGVRFLSTRYPPVELALPYGWVTEHRFMVGPRRWLPRCARSRHDRGGCLLYPETVVSTRLIGGLPPPPAASQRLVLHPSTTFHHRGFL